MKSKNTAHVPSKQRSLGRVGGAKQPGPHAAYKLLLLQQKAKAGWLRQQTFISHGSGGCKVQGQGASTARSWRKPSSCPERAIFLPEAHRTERRASSPVSSYMALTAS